MTGRTSGACVALGGALALGCAGVNIDALGKVGAAAESVDDEMLPMIVLVGLSEPDGVNLLPKACAEAVGAAGMSGPDQRAPLLAMALAEDCTLPCAASAADVLGPVAMAAPEDKTRLAHAACVTDLADPVFGLAVAPLRERMNALDYLAFRLLFVKVFDATGASGPERERWERIHDDLALSLAMMDAQGFPERPWGADGAEVSPFLDTGTVKSAVDAAKPALDACRGGAIVASRLELALLAGSDGKVSDSRLLRSDGPAFDAACVKQVVSGLKLADRVDGRSAAAIVRVVVP